MGCTQRPPLTAQQQEAIHQFTQAVTTQLDTLLASIGDTVPEEAHNLSQIFASSLHIFKCIAGVHKQSYASVTASGLSGPSGLNSFGTASGFGSLGQGGSAPGMPPNQHTRRTPPSSQQQSKTTATEAQKRHQDAKILVRLPKEHPLRLEHPVDVRAKANNAVGTELFHDAQPIPSGFALATQDTAMASQILREPQALQEALQATKIEAKEAWAGYLITPVPKAIRSYDGSSVQVSNETLASEFKLQARFSARKIYWTRKSTTDTTAQEGEVVVYLPAGQPPPTRFRFLGTPVTMRPIRKANTIPVCETCHGFHQTRGCRKSHKCVTCGKAKHEGPCLTTRCLNCRGPHPANDPQCPARPKIQGGILTRPTRIQLQAIRSAGGAAWVVKQQTDVALAPALATAPVPAPATAPAPAPTPAPVPGTLAAQATPSTPTSTLPRPPSPLTPPQAAIAAQLRAPIQGPDPTRNPG